jgi:phage major tail protein, phi13 family
MPTNPANKVKFGLSNVYYAPLTVGEDGAVTFGTPVAIPGAVNLNLPPQGDTTTFYADDIAYYVAVANNGYQGDLEIALIPESFAKDILKETLDETAKVLVENATVEPAAFALLFEFKGDKHGIRHVLYNCTAARPTVGGSTITNTKEPTTATLTLTAAPLADGRVKAKTTVDTPQETYNNWYKTVWQPTASEGP